jgi:hypothetical protein
MLVRVALLLGAAGAAPLLGGLQVEGLVSPLAVAAPFPRFSWRTGALQLSSQFQHAVESCHGTPEACFASRVTQQRL